MKVGDPGQCWEWRGAIAPGGYGSFSFRAVKYRANRAALILTLGESNKDALHLCDNPRCCNPAHLTWGTHAENMRQAIERNRIARSSGGDHWKAQLTDEQAAEVKRRLARGEKQLAIAADLGIGRMIVTDIKRGRSYRHVEV